MPRFLLALAAAAAAMLAAAPAADALVQIDRGIAGARLGNTQAQVAAKVPGVRCEVVAGDRLCHTGSFQAGKAMTLFLMDAGKVRRVDVAILFD